MPGVAAFRRRHLLRRAFGHDHAAVDLRSPSADAAFWAEVDDPVGGLVMSRLCSITTTLLPCSTRRWKILPPEAAGLPFSAGALDGLQQRLLALRAALAAVARDFRDASFRTTTFNVGGEVRERDCLSFGF